MPSSYVRMCLPLLPRRNARPLAPQSNVKSDNTSAICQVGKVSISKQVGRFQHLADKLGNSTPVGGHAPRNVTRLIVFALAVLIPAFVAAVLLPASPALDRLVQ